MMLRQLVQWWVALSLIIQLCCSPIALAQPVQVALSQTQLQELVQIQHHFVTLNDLQQRGIITTDVVRSQQNYYLNQATAIVGQPMTQTQLVTLIASDRSPSSPEFWQQTRRFLTLVNIVLFTASLLLVVALVWLSKLYLVPILRRVPPLVYEWLIYIACLSMIVGGRVVPSNLGEWVALPGCLGYVAALSYSQHLHSLTLSRFFASTRIKPASFYSFQLCLFWTVVAIVYRSSMIGFLAVIALEAFLGFTIAVLPLQYYLGFSDRSSIIRATTASFILLVFYVTVRITQVSIPYFSVFASGLVFMGAFVYYIGLLILSSRLNKYRESWQYWSLQGLTICSGIAALLVGSLWQMPTLQGIGGTFFLLYSLEKYYELPWQRQNWAWATLGLALFLYLISLIAKQYPQYFLFSFNPVLPAVGTQSAQAIPS